MDSKELRDLMEAYAEVYAPQEVDEATAVASPAPGGRGRKNSYTKEVRTSASTKTSSGYSNVKDAKDRMKKPLSRYPKPEMQLKDVKEAQYTPPPQPQQPPAEVRKAPKKAPNPMTTVGTGLAAAYVGNEIGKQLLKKKPVRGVFEELDVFDSILEYLVSEGYADNNQEALYIMANLSEEEILEYRKLAAGLVGGMMALNMMKPGGIPAPKVKTPTPEREKSELVSKVDKEKKDAEERRQADLYAQSRVDQARRTGLMK